MTAFSIQVQSIYDVQQLQSLWLDLQQRADCSYFQSWGWIGAWLHVIENVTNAQLLSVYDGQRLIGLAILMPATLKRRYVFRSSVMFVNEYPLDGNNMVIEYNGILAERDYEQQVYTQVLRYFSAQFPDVDEYCFGAVSHRDRNFLQQACPDSLTLLQNEQSVCYQADLDFDPPTLDGYLSKLSRNSREQIRRSKRLYEKQGELQLHVATSVDEALAWLDSLKQLHQQHWQGKGQHGAFANPRWESMQRELIRSRFAAGEIQLLQLRCGDQVVACLFNYVRNERVYVLQMGFRYQDDNRIKPGYLAHALAIVYNRQQGHQLYDFMHGESRYKTSMSNRQENLYWLSLQRPKWKFRLEKAACTLVRRLRGDAP